MKPLMLYKKGDNAQKKTAVKIYLTLTARKQTMLRVRPASRPPTSNWEKNLLLFVPSLKRTGGQRQIQQPRP